MEFNVLYTHQKTKKSKKWQDGKLRVSNNGRVILMNDSGSQVETVYVKADQIKVGEEIESDRHLITIEEESNDPNGCNQRHHEEPLRSTSNDGNHHKTQQIPLMRKNPLRRKRMGFTVPRPLNQQTSPEVCKENICDSTSHRDVKFKRNDSTRHRSLPATTDPPYHFHNSENSSQKASVWFNVHGKNKLNEQKGEVTGRECQPESTFIEDERVPSCVSQPHRIVNKVSTIYRYVQPNEENVLSNDNESHKSSGKRSASQILALLGKRKHSFQPPLKKAKVQTEKTVMDSDFDIGTKIFNPEFEKMFIQEEPLDEGRQEHQSESEEFSGSIDDDREEILKVKLQGMSALHALTLSKAEETSPDNTFQSKNCTQELEQRLEYDNGHETISQPNVSLIKTHNSDNELGQQVSHMERSCGKDSKSFGVVCIHKTKDGEDCRNLEVRVSGDEDVNKEDTTGSCSVVTEEHSLDAVRDVVTKNLEELQRTSEQQEHANKDDSGEHDKIKVKIAANEGYSGINIMIAGGGNVSSVDPLGGASTVPAIDVNCTTSEEHSREKDGVGSGKAEGEMGRSDTKRMAKDLERGVFKSGEDTERVSQTTDLKRINDEDARTREDGDAGTREEVEKSSLLNPCENKEDELHVDGGCSVTQCKGTSDNVNSSSAMQVINAVGLSTATVESKTTKDEITGGREGCKNQIENGRNVNKSDGHDGGNCRNWSSKVVVSGCHHSWLGEEDNLPGMVDDGDETGSSDFGDTDDLLQLTDSSINKTESSKDEGPSAMLVFIDSPSHKSTTLSDQAVFDVTNLAESTSEASQNMLSDAFTSEPAGKIPKTGLCNIDKDRRLEENTPPKEVGGLNTFNAEAASLCLKPLRVERDWDASCNLTPSDGPGHEAKSNIIGQSEVHDSSKTTFEEDGNLTLEEDPTDEATVTERIGQGVNENIHEMYQPSVTTSTCNKTSVPDEKITKEMSGSCELTDVYKEEKQEHTRKDGKGLLESKRLSAAVLITSSEGQNITVAQPHIGNRTAGINEENLLMRCQDQQMPQKYASSLEPDDIGYTSSVHFINHNSVKIVGNDTKHLVSSDKHSAETLVKDSAKGRDKVVAGCMHEAVDTSDEMTREHPPSVDSLVGDHHFQDKHLPSEGEDAATPTCLHTRSQNEMEKYNKDKVGAETVEIYSKDENSDTFITNKGEARTPSSAEHHGDSCHGSAAQLGGIQSNHMIDSSSDLTYNYSQNSLLSVTSIDTLEYSLPSSLPEQLQPLTSVDESNPLQNTREGTHASCTVDSGGDFTASTSNMANRGDFIRDGGNCPSGCNSGVTQLNDDSSQEFLNDVAEIFEKSRRRIQNGPDGVNEDINSAGCGEDGVESIVKITESVDEIPPSLQLSDFTFGEMKNEKDVPLCVSPVSSMAMTEQLKEEDAEIEAIPDVSTMIHLHYHEDDSVSENLYSEDPFSFSSLHASNILTHPSKLHSPGSSDRGDITKLSQKSREHSRSRRHSHYWRQPLASSLVRRRHPSPTVIHASSCRDELNQQESLKSLLQRQKIHPSNTLTEAEQFDDFAVNFSCGSFPDNSGTAVDEKTSFDIHGCVDIRDGREPSFSKPMRDFPSPGHSPNHGTFMNVDQQCVEPFSDHKLFPGLEADYAGHWGDKLIPFVTRDCSSFKSTNVSHEGVNADESDSKTDTVFYDNNETLYNHHMVDELLYTTAARDRGRWYEDAGTPAGKSSQTPALVNLKIPATLDQTEVPTVLVHDTVSCHRGYSSRLEHSVPSVSQDGLASVPETPFQDHSSVKMLSKPASVVCTPQCVPSASPVVTIEDKSSHHAENQLDTQSENLRWLEGSSPIHSQRSKFVPHSPRVTGVDMFTIDEGGTPIDSDDACSEQTVALLDRKEMHEWKECPSNVSRPSESPLLCEPAAEASSGSTPVQRIRSCNDSFHEETDVSKASMQSKLNISQRTTLFQNTVAQKLLKTPVIAMVTEDYSSAMLFQDCKSFESREKAHSAERQSENEQKRSSFNLPEPYTDGLNDNFVTFHTQYKDGNQSSGRRRHPSPQFQSLEPRQNNENVLDDTLRSNLEKIGFQNDSALQKHDRYAESVPSQTRTGFQTPFVRKPVTDLKRIDTSAEIGFPCLKDISVASIPQRQVQIPISFSEAALYKQVLTAVLKEHLNIILYEVAYNYFSALSKVDVSSYSPLSNSESTSVQNPVCQHKQPSKRICVKKDGPNKGRFFFTCGKPRGNQCKFFQWADQGGSKSSSHGEPRRPSKEVLNDSKSIEMYLKSFGVSLYCECQLLRKSPFSDQLSGAPTWIKKYRQNQLNNEKKKLYLKISRRENSSVYGKDDLWVISRDLTFDSGNSFLAKSMFHGPNTAGEVEIEPLSGYTPSNWITEMTVHALHAYNASTELTCFNNIQEFVNPRTLPILPALLKRYSSDPSLSNVHPTSFKSPVISSSCNKRLCCSSQQIMELADDVIQQYHLNVDQAKALLSVAGMFMDSQNVQDQSPVCLIHGVFGAGKSYLLAVTVLFLCQLFQLHQTNGGKPNEWKVLISSTTNVAVDRILLSLLQLGFEEFIRVGSMRKIAKPVLPYSVHASGKETQELKELQQMLRGDLSKKEKSFVRKTIERHRLGVNQKMLSKVLVVGVTCAACSFPCVANLKFPVVLLDECSQITEPACLLPVARFECQKLVLVGDPKQLDPTIQGSECPHKFNLEQTLFDRLMLLGYEPTMLRTQYRCHPRISCLANELFYEKKLVDGVDERERKELVEVFPTLCFYDVANGKECPVTGGSFLNDKEATFVVTMLEVLLLSGIEPSQVGIITLYKAQVFHISTLLLQSRLVGLRDLKAIQISTVDAFQGGEKDIVILSCVRSDFMGFAASDKRTNVALTRSKYHLLIVGNQRILSQNSLWSKVILKCKECKNGVQDSSRLLREWSSHLDKVMLEEKTKKKSKPAPGKMKKTSIIISEPDCITAGSPPISLDSQDDYLESTGTHVTFSSTDLISKEDNPKIGCLSDPSQKNLDPVMTDDEISHSADTASNETKCLKLRKNNFLAHTDSESDTNLTAKVNMDLNDDCDLALSQAPSPNCLKSVQDEVRMQSECADTEKVDLPTSDSNRTPREPYEANQDVSSLVRSSEDDKMQRNTSVKRMMITAESSSSFERTTTSEGNNTAYVEDNTASEERNATKMQNDSPSYSPLEEVLESSEDELLNFDLETDLLF